MNTPAWHHEDIIVTCDNCTATSESGWGDTPLCTDCEAQENVCQWHVRTFYDECPLCEYEANEPANDYAADLNWQDSTFPNEY